jgi:uncharacterized integral membrane protein
MLKRSSTRGESGAASGAGIWWAYVVGLVALAAILVLALQNGHEVRFEWLWIDFDASLAVMLLATVLVTMVATSVIGLLWRARRRHTMAGGIPANAASEVRGATPEARPPREATARSGASRGA